jgi:ABC-type thiamine transport system substrate-binding protein
VRGAKHAKEAREFIDMMLEDEFQDLVGLNVMLPVVPGAEVNATYLEHGKFAIEHVEPEQELIASEYSDWLTEWDRAFS